MSLRPSNLCIISYACVALLTTVVVRLFVALVSPQGRIPRNYEEFVSDEEAPTWETNKDGREVCRRRLKSKAIEDKPVDTLLLSGGDPSQSRYNSYVLSRKLNEQFSSLLSVRGRPLCALPLNALYSRGLKLLTCLCYDNSAGRC